MTVDDLMRSWGTFLSLYTSNPTFRRNMEVLSTISLDQFLEKNIPTHNKTYTVIRMDGGICSQMWQYMQGYILQNAGRHILYDLSWFEYCGRDMNNSFARPFMLTKLYPGLYMPLASSDLLQQYKQRYKFIPDDTSKWIGINNFSLPPEPVYLDGYYFPLKDVFKLYKDVFKIDIDKIEGFDEENKLWAEKILADNYSVGVHVRRSDMSNNLDWTMGTLQPSYFIEAIKSFGDTRYTFYFFSDEMDWVAKNIVPWLKDIKCVMVAGNDSSKGYCDLALISLCKHQILSQGSMAGIASILNENKQKVLVIPSRSGVGCKYHADFCSWEDICDARIKYVEIQ